MTAFPQSLRHWRRTRRLSQLDLAGEAGVSARHIAFLETGRSRPSAAMVARLSMALDLPMTAHNEMLTQAGFAVRHPSREWGAAEMAPVRAAVARLLDRHAPYPGIAIDRLWTVTAMNRPAQRLFGALGLAAGTSMIDLMLSDTLPPLIENWPQVAHQAAQRLRTEAAACGGDPVLAAAAQALARVDCPQQPAMAPVIPTVLRFGGQRLALFAMLTQFGTPDDLTLADLKLELYFPADKASAALLRDMDEASDAA